MENVDKKQAKASTTSSADAGEKASGGKSRGGGLQEVKSDVVHSTCRAEVIHCSPKKEGDKVVYQIAALVDEPVQDYATRAWRMEKQLHTLISTVDIPLGTHTLIRKSGVSLYKKADGTLTKGEFKDKIVGIL